MAPVSQQTVLKGLLGLSAVITTSLLVYQSNVPEDSSNLSNQISQHKHRNDFLSLSTGFNSLTEEVPRNILGKEIRYVLNNPICDCAIHSKNCKDEVFVLILITSYAGDVTLRRKIRDVMPQSELDEVKMKRLFLLAKPPPGIQTKDFKYADVTMTDVYRENEEFHDLLMGDFVESYKNLTYKHLMGLEWAATFCQNARFVLKQDDDILVDYYHIREMLITELGPQLSDPLRPTIFGKLLDHQPVIREIDSKWFVPETEYRSKMYPAFVSGWAYLTTVPVIQELLEVSVGTQYFFIDDAFVTGILREKTEITLKDMGDVFTQYKGQLLCCVAVPAFARSKNNEPYWCDYIVGPSNDDLELIEIFYRHSQFCFVSKSCKRRGDDDLLAKKCVITGNMKVQDFSQMNSPGSGKGAWKPMAVIRKQ